MKMFKGVNEKMFIQKTNYALAILIVTITIQNLVAQSIGDFAVSNKPEIVRSGTSSAIGHLAKTAVEAARIVNAEVSPDGTKVSYTVIRSSPAVISIEDANGIPRKVQIRGHYIVNDAPPDRTPTS